MDKKDFGSLVAILRKEARNEFDEPMTQLDLAQLARIPVITLQKIEQGRQVNLKPELLQTLASALHLCSRANQTFFLASLGIKDVQTVRPIASPQAILADLSQTLARLQTPAYILDGFGDILFINPAGLAVFNLDLARLHAPHLLSQYNLMRLLFSPEFDGQRSTLVETGSASARRTVMLHKLLSLKLRPHWYFQRLLPELNRYPLFRQYWQSPSFHDEDIYVQYNSITLEHPKHGRLNFLSSPFHAITSRGDLYLFSLQPLDAHTAEISLRLTRDLGTRPLPLAAWPKPSVPAGSLEPPPPPPPA